MDAKHPDGTVRRLHNKTHGSRLAKLIFYPTHVIAIDMLNNQFKAIKHPKKDNESKADSDISSHDDF